VETIVLSDVDIAGARPFRQEQRQASVAVITRTKDRPVLLKRAVRSVLDQTYPDWLHVIVNDGGDPATVDRIVRLHAEEYAGRSLVIHNARSGGMEAASNKGIDAVRSAYIAVHDDDDTWEPEFLSRMIMVLKSHQEDNPVLGGIVCHSEVVNESLEEGGVRELSRHPFNAWMSDVSLWRMLESNTFPPISFLFSRRAYEDVGPFDEQLRVLGDWDFHIRFLLAHDIAVLPEVLAYYHHRPSGAGIYGNSVHDGQDAHRLTRSRMENRLLREDLRQGRYGIGSAMAQSTMLGIHASTLNQQGLAIRKIQKRMRRLLWVVAAATLLAIASMLIAAGAHVR
jgi:glycosyltransferase involved in cell wall biosynthesis